MLEYIKNGDGQRQRDPRSERGPHGDAQGLSLEPSVRNSLLQTVAGGGEKMNSKT